MWSQMPVTGSSSSSLLSVAKGMWQQLYEEGQVLETVALAILLHVAWLEGQAVLFAMMHGVAALAVPNMAMKGLANTQAAWAIAIVAASVAGRLPGPVLPKVRSGIPGRVTPSRTGVTLLPVWAS